MEVMKIRLKPKSLLITFMMIFPIIIFAIPLTPSTYAYYYGASDRLSEVGNTASDYQWYHKTCFYAQGRWWSIYSNAGNAVYKSSIDGITWNAEQTIHTEASICIWVQDERYIHIATKKEGDSSIIQYRRGELFSNGSIIWTAALVDVIDDIRTQGLEGIATDSNGYPWILYSLYDGSWGTYNYAMKSTLNDGSGWTTDFRTNVNYSTHIAMRMYPLSSGKMMFVYSRDVVSGQGTCYAKLYNGAWQPDTKLSNDGEVPNNDYIGITGYGNDSSECMVSYIKNNAGQYDLMGIQYSSGWGSPTTIQSDVTGQSPALFYESERKVVLSFWVGKPEKNTVFYKRYYTSTDVWDSTPRVWCKPQIQYDVVGNKDKDQTFYGATWLSQSFLAYDNASLYGISAYLKRGAGTSSVTINVNIYAGDSEGKPTGSSLGSTTITSFTTTTYAWKDATFSTKPELTHNHTYCIVLSAPAGTSGQYYQWGGDITSPSYSDGLFSNSTNSGTSWTAYLSEDLFFKAKMNGAISNNATSVIPIIRTVSSKIAVQLRTDNTGNDNLMSMSASNLYPIIGEFEAPATIYANQLVFLNFTCVDLDGYSDLAFGQIDLEGDIVIGYNFTTSTFYEAQDPHHYYTLYASTSTIHTKNATAIEVSIRGKFSPMYLSGYKDLEAEYTRVQDICGHYDSGDKPNFFYFNENPISGGEEGGEGYPSGIAPLDIYYNYTNFLYTEDFTTSNATYYNSINHRITVYNSLDEPIVLSNAIFTVRAIYTTTNAEIDLGLRQSPNGTLLTTWTLAFNTTATTVYYLNITLPKPMIGDSIIMDFNTTEFDILMGSYTSNYPVYDEYGVEQGWTAYFLIQYFDFPFNYKIYPHSHFSPYSADPFTTTSSKASFKYIDKPSNMYVILNITGQFPHYISSNYLIYSPDELHHYIALPFNYFYNIGECLFSISGDYAYAVVPYDEDSRLPLYGECAFQGGYISGTYFLLYECNNESLLATYVSGNYLGAHRTLPLAKILKMYFPTSTFYAYTFSADFGNTYKVYDKFGNLLDIGNVTSPSKTFVIPLLYGKTYRIIIDNIHIFDVGADTNTMRYLFDFTFPSYDKGDITFLATRNGTWATVYFRDRHSNGSTTLTTYGNQGGSYAELSTVTLPSGTYVWSFDVDPNQDYIVKASYSASPMGPYTATIPIQQTSVSDWSLMMGTFTVNGVQLSVTSFLFTTVLFGIFALFSQENAEIGIIIGIILGFFLSWFNLINWTASIANLAWGIVMVAVFELMAKKETGR